METPKPCSSQVIFIAVTLILELCSVEHVFQDSPAGVLELGQS